MVMILPPATEGAEARMDMLIKDADGSCLEYLYRTIGDGCRCIECVHLDGNIDMWVDEEAAIKAEPLLNEYATSMARIMTDKPYKIYGTAVVACHDGEGDTVDLTDEAKESIHVAILIDGLYHQAIMNVRGVDGGGIE